MLTVRALLLSFALPLLLLLLWVLSQAGRYRCWKTMVPQQVSGPVSFHDFLRLVVGCCHHHLLLFRFFNHALRMVLEQAL